MNRSPHEPQPPKSMNNEPSRYKAGGSLIAQPSKSIVPAARALDDEALQALTQVIGQTAGPERDRLCEQIQDRAERVLLDAAGSSAVLVALPVILSYAHRTRLLGQESLLSGANPSMSRILGDMWGGAVPDELVVPYASTLRLDLALAATPGQVRSAIQSGAGAMKAGNLLRHHWDIDGAKAWEAVPPVPAVLLALAAVQLTSSHSALGNRTALHVALRGFAERLGAIFATVQEVPSVTLGPPLPFYRACERAVEGQLRHLSGWSGPGSRSGSAAPVRVDVYPVQGGQAARVVLTSMSELSDNYGDRIDSWDLDWTWRTAEALSRVTGLAAAPQHEDDYWLSVQGRSLMGVRH